MLTVSTDGSVLSAADSASQKDPGGSAAAYPWHSSPARGQSAKVKWRSGVAGAHGIDWERGCQWHSSPLSGSECHCDERLCKQ